MNQIALRSVLRNRTAALHEQLDRFVGEFSSRADYADYVANTHRFRSAVEANLPQSDLWHVTSLADALTSDLADLNRAPKLHGESVDLGTSANALGVFYVLEGSAVGARLLLRRAKEIGMSETSGARHLALQAGDTARWPRFLALLETAPHDLHDAIVEGSLSTFRLALESYGQPVS